MTTYLPAARLGTSYMDLAKGVQDQIVALRGGLVVSCQAHGETSVLRDSAIMAVMAAAAVQGGAVGIRADGPADIQAMRLRVGVPIIGMKKRATEDGLFITPGRADVREVVEAGARLVALDGTSRPRPGGESLSEVIHSVHEMGAAALADVSTLEEGLAAARMGADLVGTTLSGYTANSAQQEAPDFDLLRALVESCDVPVFAEGRIWTPDQARQALAIGATFVVVGTAITDPVLVTARFVRALQ